ncbi:MAG TPA: D-glycero-beta-D-manno-heptose-7-phosphate kinase, partial [Rhodospirillales bacterium]|nr:D-glycero-beta-D-manno-heptose-7-phosphate kinase [Rhodospirillales bacterium]
MSDPTDLISLVEGLGAAKVLCVGDVILDHFQYGRVERISPEAPIPVLKLERQDTMLGGAGNVVRNLAALKSHVRFFSVVGNDHDGREVKILLADQGVNDAPLIDDKRRTSIKTRFLADGQQMLRTDRETDIALDGEKEKELIDAVQGAMADCNVMVLSDYRKGVLTRSALKTLIESARKTGITVIVDPKGNDYSLYQGAGILTPNRRELTEATHMAVDTDAQIIAAAEKLITDHRIDAVLVTRSRDGMTLVQAEGEPCHLSAEAQDIFDVSGAGDTVVAALAAALSTGAGLEDAARLANVAAGIVVGKVGTAVASADDVIGALHHQHLSSGEAKVMALEQALDRIDQWRRRGKSIGFTNGCFDLLHPGHISLLQQAASACDRLIIGINSDTSIKRLKGDDRPVQSEAARAAVMASLSHVDLIIIFAEDTPLQLIEAIKPDVLVKGADYTVATVVGAEIVQAYGGRIVLAELSPGHSTTATIAR